MTRNIRTLLVAPILLITVLLPSCGTHLLPTSEKVTASAKPPKGHAIVYGDGIVSVNGKKTKSGKKGIAIPKGQNVVLVQSTPAAAKLCPTKLTFSAQSGQAYRVKTRAFPEKIHDRKMNYEGGRQMDGIRNVSDFYGDGAAMFLVPVALGAGTAETVLRMGGDIAKAVTPAEASLDVMIVSEDPQEGVVAWVRLDPDGTASRMQ